MNDDIIRIIISKCSASTLFKLAGTCRSVNAMISWQPAAKKIPHNHGLSPMRLANLTCFSGCMACRKPRITKITWEFGVRFCTDCIHRHTVSNYHIDTWDIPKSMYKHLPHTSAELYNRKFGMYDLDFYWKETIMSIFRQLHGDITPTQYLEQKARRLEEEKQRRKEEREIHGKERKKLVHEALKPVLKPMRFTLKDCHSSKTYKRVLNPAVALPDGWTGLVVKELEDSQPPKNEESNAIQWSVPTRKPGIYTTTDCNECKSNINVMYHSTGIGPLCKTCIEADPDLAGLKWKFIHGHDNPTGARPLH